MSISDRLDQIEARADAATEGPWEKRTVNGWGMVVSYSTDAMIQLVAEFRHKERDLNDAEFIAHARTDVPELVEAVRRRDAALRAVLDLEAEYALAAESGDPGHVRAANVATYIRRAVESALGEDTP